MHRGKDYNSVLVLGNITTQNFSIYIELDIKYNLQPQILLLITDTLDDLYSNPVYLSSFSILFSKICISIESRVLNIYFVVVV